MFSEAEGYIREEPVQPPPLASQTGYRGQTAPRGATLLRPLFLPKLLRTKWEIGEHL
jgi:hypothetical protein